MVLKALSGIDCGYLWASKCSKVKPTTGLTLLHSDSGLMDWWHQLSRDRSLRRQLFMPTQLSWVVCLFILKPAQDEGQIVSLPNQLEASEILVKAP